MKSYMHNIKLLIRNNNRIMVACSLIYRILGRNHIKCSNSNVINIKGVFIKKSHIIVKGHNNLVKIGEGCRINNLKVHIWGDNNQIDIGNDCVADNLDIWIEDNENRVVVGEHTWFNGRCNLACIEGRKIEIGDRCLLSSEITFRTGDSHSIINNEGERINPAKDISIGKHVWICNQAYLLKGTKVGNDCVIGARSLLSGKEYGDGTLIAGNPGKVIKSHIGWDSQRI